MPQSPKLASSAVTAEALASIESAKAKEARKALKAAKLAAKEAAEAAEAAEAVEAEETQDDRAARKALRVAARKAAEAAAIQASDDSESSARSVPEKKRKAEPAPQEAEKRRKDANGEPAIITKPLGAAAFRKAHDIVVACKCPDPFATFDEAEPQLGAVLSNALRKQGYLAPTPIQAQAWPIALTGQDIVAVAKTGSGKTCGFLLPAFVRIVERGPAGPPQGEYWNKQPSRPSVLVLSPTRELAQQIAAEANKFVGTTRSRVVTLFGGAPKGDQVRELNRGADMVIATPGRLLDLAEGQPNRGLQPSVSLDKVSYLVLDEADRMLDMGFEKDISKIISQCPKGGKPEEGGGAPGPKGGQKRQTLFFTATWPKAVQRTAAAFTSSDAVQIRIGQGASGDKLTANASVKQTIMVISDWDKTSTMKDVLGKELGDNETAIVFAATQVRCDSLEQEIKSSFPGVFCSAIHGGKAQWEREEALSKFRSTKRGVLVATDVAARGLDIPGVAIVLVYDFGAGIHKKGSAAVEDYVHRIGRTGRGGKTGRSFAFFTPKDSGAKELVELLKGAAMAVPKELLSLCGSGGGGKGKGSGKGGGKSWGKSSWGRSW